MKPTATTWRESLPERTGGRRRASLIGSMLSVIGAVALMAGCSDDGGGGSSDSAATTDASVAEADTTGAPSASTEPATSSSVSDATTSAAPTTATAASTTTIPAPLPVLTRASIVNEFSLAPSGYASALLAPANGRGLLLVGDLQQQAGERWTPTIWESADGTAWAAGDSAPFSAGVSASAQGAAWAETTLAVGGYFIDPSGRQPAVWVAADGRTFAAPENPFAATGLVSIVAGSGPRVLVAGQIERGSDQTGAVAVRSVDGTWTTADLGVSGQFSLAGLSASGSDVVVTGWISTEEGDRAAAWVSHDAGATFAAADTSGLVGAGDTYLTEATTWPSGFVAAACLSSPDGPVSGVATSSDGNSWEVLPVAVNNAEGAPVTLANSGCGSISVAGSTVLVGLREIGASVLQVDASGHGRVFEAPRGSGQISQTTPLTAVGPSGVVVVSREASGMSAGIESEGSVPPTATGLPRGHPYATDVLVEPVIGGADTAVTLYPLVHENADGGGYGYGSARSWYVSADLQTWANEPSFLDTDIDVVASNGSVDVGFAVSDDPRDAGNGPAGGAQAWSRADGQAWVSHGIIAGGVGGQAIVDVDAVDGGFLGVGLSRTRDQQSGAVTSTPLVLFSTDGAAWTAESPPTPAPDASITEICPLAGGAQLVFGQAVANGASSPFAAVRALDGTWQTSDTTALGAAASFTSCASNGTATVVAFTSAGRSTLLTTVDGTSFTPVDQAALGSVDTQVDGVAGVGGRFVAAGQISENGLTRLRIWTSADGVTWAPLPVDGLADVAAQGFVSVSTVGDRLAITGMYFDAPTVWSVPLSALAA